MPINTHGPVAQGTQRNLITGLWSRPMRPERVAAIVDQATRVAEKFVDKYSTSVARDEVGPGGTARAADAPILANRTPTLLLYGRVQSGKTATMILTSALCFDNGFRVVVVLTSDNVALVQQTADRFRDLAGPRVFSTIAEDRYEWEGQEDELREEIATDGLVLVCAKNDRHMGHILQFLQAIDAPSYPAIIFDDEADAATPDTTLQARMDGRPNAPNLPSAINRRVFENAKPGQEGESFGEVFPHKLYVQVTATPYIFFLQPEDSPIRPSETILLNPGEGYRGGESFFENFDPSAANNPDPPLVFVPPNELQSIPRRTPTPLGLARSIDFFLIASLARSHTTGWPEKGFKHLSHSSPSMGHHEMVANHITRHLAGVRRLIRQGNEALIARFQPAYDELHRSLPGAPELRVLVREFGPALQHNRVIVMNSAHEMPQAPGPRFNFVVGGNILGRGLTIDDLIVTYYVREARVSQMDTVWQHARMYGYRTDLMPYTRVYVPRSVAANFRGIHESETALRFQLENDPEGVTPVLRVPRGTRPTRPNAVDNNYFRVIPANTAQITAHRVAVDPAAARAFLLRLQALDVPVSVEERAARVTPVPFDRVLELVDAVPIVDNDAGQWNSDAVLQILQEYRRQHGDFGFVYVRQLDGALDRTRARLSGNEVTMIRNASNNMPTVVLLYTGNAENPEGWHPTLVMPPNIPTMIVSPST